MVLLHHLTEFRRDAGRQVRRDPTAEADNLDVRDLTQALEEVLEPPVGEHHRVAARHDHVADLRVLAEILEGRLVLVERDLFGVADFAAARAEPAVRRADGTHQEECPVGISMRDVRDRRVTVFVERVDHAVDDVELLDRGHVLLPHRVPDLLDRAQDVRRETHLEIVERRLQAIDIDDVGPVPISELVEGIDALVEDLLPVTHARRLRGSVEGPANYEGEGLRRLTYTLSLIHISEPTRLLSISYAVFCLK